MELQKMALHLTEVMTTKAIVGFGLDRACVDFFGNYGFSYGKKRGYLACSASHLVIWNWDI